MAAIKIVDGAIRLPDTKKNRDDVRDYLRNLIEKKGVKVKKTGKPSKDFKGFPKVYFSGVLTEFRNKAKADNLTTSAFNFANKGARDKEKNLRDQDLKAANALYSDEEVKKGKAKQKEIRKTGNEADHDFEVQEFGPAKRNLDYELSSGRIGKREYNRQLKILKDRGVGDVAANTVSRTQTENIQKKDEVLAKNKALAAMEAKNRSFRFEGNEFIQNDPLYRTAKSRRNRALKANKNGNNGENGHNGKVNGKVNGGKKNGKFNFGSFDVASKTRSVDAWANIAANTATGAYGAAGVGVGVLGMTTALQNPATQRAIGKQVQKLISKQAGKTMLKTIPGLDILLSGQETIDRLKKGQLKQAGIAALSGAIGWVPIIGDGAAASLDLSNTGIDIYNLQFPSQTSKKPTKGTTRRPKIRI